MEKEEIQNNVTSWVNDKIGSNFVFREYQLETIVDILYNILTDAHHNQVIEAPTGSGKSIINIICAGVLADYYKITSYILASDLYLWDQYYQFIRKHKNLNFGTIKGQTGNYLCKANGEDVRNGECRIGGIAWANLFNKKRAAELGYSCAAHCPYVKERKKALGADVCLMTYQLFLFIMNNIEYNMDSHGHPIFEHKDVIFCDECHNVASIVQQQHAPCIKKEDFIALNEIFSIVVQEDSMQQDDLFSNIEENHEEDFDFTPITAYYNRTTLNAALDGVWAQFIKEDSNKTDDINAMNKYINIINLFKDHITCIVNDISRSKFIKKKITKEELHRFKLCTWFQNYCCFWTDFVKAIAETGNEYLLKDITVLNEDGSIHVSFKCTKEDYLVYRFLLLNAKFNVMMSATIGGQEAFTENNGFKYTEDGDAKFTFLPPTFDFSNSPVYFLNKFKMGHRDKEVSTPKIEKILFDALSNKLADYKGLILTGSYALAKQIYNDAPTDIKDRLLLYNGSNEKTRCIEIHKHSKNTIIIGPTLNEGIDLPGDMCRFIFIVKMPYPSLVDKLVKEKIKLFPLWYNSSTSMNIIQGIGRGVRYNGDWCVTYILDACFWNLYMNTIDQYPEEFKERLKFL